jgi:uncharacterized protein (DUF2141 family)
MRFLAFLLLPLALGAQTPAGTVSGTVVNAITSEPVRRALVTIRRIDSSPGTTTVRVTSAVSTDSTGSFTITGIGPGTYRLSASHNGFIPAEYGARGPNKSGTPMVLAAGQKSTGLLVTLYPHGVISGRVLDEDGEPVPNAEVQVSRLQYMQGHKLLARSDARITNDLGEYRIFALAPGRYYLNATYRQDQVATDAATAAGEGIYVSTYYPRTSDPPSATPLDLSPGAQLHNVDVVLARVRTVTVKGRVTSEVGGNLNVVLSANNPLGTGGGNGRGAPVMPDGAFTFSNVVPGSYVLVAMANTPGKSYTARLPLAVGAANIEGLSLAIHSPITIAGEVKVDGETTQSLSRINVAIQPWDNDGAAFGPMPNVPLKSDGSFQIADLSAEHYRVNLYNLPDGFYVKSIRTATVDVQSAGLDLSAGASQPLSIVLSPNAGELTGTVLDPKTQKPVAAVTVVAVPQEKDRRDRETFYKTTTTDQSGQFRFKNLIPGDYKIFSWDDVPYGSWMDPDFLAPHDSHGEPVSIREGSPQSIQLTLIVE